MYFYLWKFRKLCSCNHCTFAATLFNHNTTAIKKRNQYNYDILPEHKNEWEYFKSLGWYRRKGRFMLKSGLDPSQLWNYVQSICEGKYLLKGGLDPSQFWHHGNFNHIIYGRENNINKIVGIYYIYFKARMLMFYMFTITSMIWSIKH